MTARAYFAGGCFWCMAKPYGEIPGVLSVVSGYSGGEEPSPRYEDVKAQLTGHRETVMVEYDPAVVSFAALLDTYLYNIDPFDPGGQFIDRGHSYSCAVYFTCEEEKEIAKARFAAVRAEYGRDVCVAVEPFRFFVPAEAYHQDYAARNPEAYAEEVRVSGREARKEEDRVKPGKDRSL